MASRQAFRLGVELYWLLGKAQISRLVFKISGLDTIRL
jgi:hypothetical protein